MQALVLVGDNVCEDQHGDDFGDNGQDGDDENKGDGEKINLWAQHRHWPLFQEDSRLWGEINQLNEMCKLAFFVNEWQYVSKHLDKGPFGSFPKIYPFW